MFSDGTPASPDPDLRELPDVADVPAHHTVMGSGRGGPPAIDEMTSQDPFYFFIYVLPPEVVFLVTFQSQHEQVLEGARCPVFKKISKSTSIFQLYIRSLPFILPRFRRDCQYLTLL